MGFIKAAHHGQHPIGSKENGENKTKGKQVEARVIGDIVNKGKQALSRYTRHDALNFTAKVKVKIFSFRQVLDEHALKKRNERKKRHQGWKERQEVVEGNRVGPGKEVLTLAFVVK